MGKRRSSSRSSGTFRAVVFGAAAVIAFAWVTRAHSAVPPRAGGGPPAVSSTTRTAAPPSTRSTPPATAPSTTVPATSPTATAPSTTLPVIPPSTAAAAPAPAITPVQIAVIQCLENNGITPAASLADATDSAAQGALLTLCRANPSYVQEVGYCPAKGGACTMYFGAAAVSPKVCPPTLHGRVAGSRIALTIGLPTATGYKAEPAIIDSGSPSSYVLGPQVAGTTLTYVGDLANTLFPFWKGAQYGVPAKAYKGTLTVLDAGQWESIGPMAIEVLEGSPGAGIKDALGVDAFQVAHLAMSGDTWALTFPCG